MMEAAKCGPVPPGSPASSELLLIRRVIVVVPKELRVKKALVKNRKRGKKPADEVVYNPSAPHCAVIAEVEAGSGDDDDGRLEFGMQVCVGHGARAA